MNKKLRSEKAKKKAISLFEIFLMVISVVTFAYFVGEEFGVVRAFADTSGSTSTTTKCYEDLIEFSVNEYTEFGCENECLGCKGKCQKKCLSTGKFGKCECKEIPKCIANDDSGATAEVGEYSTLGCEKQCTTTPCQKGYQCGRTCLSILKFDICKCHLAPKETTTCDSLCKKSLLGGDYESGKCREGFKCEEGENPIAATGKNDCKSEDVCCCKLKTTTAVVGAECSKACENVQGSYGSSLNTGEYQYGFCRKGCELNEVDIGPKDCANSVSGPKSICCCNTKVGSENSFCGHGGTCKKGTADWKCPTGFAVIEGKCDTTSGLVCCVGSTENKDAISGATTLVDEGEEVMGDLTKKCTEQGGTSCSAATHKCNGQIVQSSDMGTNCCVGDCTPLAEGEKPKQEGFLGLGTVLGSIVEGFLWGAAVYVAARTVIPMLSTDKNLVDAGSLALGLGFWAGKSVYGLMGGGTEAGVAAGSMTTGIVVGAIVSLAVFAFMYKKESQEVVTFNCLPWQAPIKGNYCEECNNQGILPCTEYQCRSLGQSCQLENKGTKQEKCVWINKNDVNFPTIEPWEGALTECYDYTPNNKISPPDKGVFIKLQGGSPTLCPSSSTGYVRAFTPLTFGITTDEPAQCKFDILRKDTFDEMSYSFSEGLFLQNHSTMFSLPGAAALESAGITLENDGEYNIYVKCQDANGNANEADFVFKFNVEKGPDTTPPLIVGTSIPSGSPFASGKLSVPGIEVYVNEPVEGCKWDHIDLTYDNMANTMDCEGANELNEMNDRGTYTCITELDGLKDREENKFYFRCKDRASPANLDKESYPYILMGTQPLVIDFVGPNGTIKDSTERVKVTLNAHTFAGYSEGKAECSFSSTEEGGYVTFLYGDAEPYSQVEHSQDLWLPEETYEYFIKCIDEGGNIDTEMVGFDVVSDVNAPLVTRAYHEETNLKIITDKPAKCVYDTTDCTYVFDDGVEMTTVENRNHYTSWNTDASFYIKCQDANGVMPDPDECTIVVRPYSGY